MADVHTTGTPSAPARSGTDDAVWLAALVPPLRDLVRAARDDRLLARVGRAAEVDVPTHLVLALTRIGDFQPVRLTDLADQMGIGRTTLSRQVADLVAAGLVARTPDPQDARAATLELTPQGTATLRLIWDAWTSLLGEATAAWGDAERQMLPLLLGRLARALTTMAED
ncbi:MarR family winged helix-turn-helix transcriptional regulator [Yinghuangia soli]|uniref:MarR family winged helix-turn-helix transcriptional regulator n=1 Tax=Yinghuangia soli TaxID=2908204 RepID=A0AA41U031_9ACTN|nr:MarR family winged helix-turn-helix transcriptional regulator [Yinghuangia soli]MCF2526007.1 MarR family winged helix-turn-helix transcriptional regulator [Yinghuangia soli]